MTTAQGLRRGRIPEFDTSDIHTRMWLARETAGLSQVELGALLSIDRRTVGNYEIGITPPTAAMLEDWAEACAGTDIEWLVGDYVKPPRKRRTRGPGSQAYVPDYLEILSGDGQSSAPRKGHLSLISSDFFELPEGLAV